MDESVSTGNRTTGQPLDAIDKADQAAREAIIALLSHAHTAAIITAHADALRALVPYAFAPDQVAVTDLGMASSIWPATGIAWLRPEGVPARGPVKPPSDWPVLVDQNDSRLTSGPWAAGWPGLPEDERAKLHAYVGNGPKAYRLARGPGRRTIPTVEPATRNGLGIAATFRPTGP